MDSIYNRNLMPIRKTKIREIMQENNQKIYGVVYKITNLKDGKGYIGQTTGTLEKRWKRHCMRSSECKFLKNAIRKYNPKNFKIEIIEKCNSIEQLNEREIYWIKEFNSTNRDFGYNIVEGGNRGPSMLNRKHSKETIEKISKSNIGKNTGKISPMKGKHHSEESKRKMSEYRKGKKASLETCEKLSKIHKGRKHSLESIQKMSQSKLNHKVSQKTREILRQKNLGKHLSEETKEKIRICSLKYRHSEDTKKKLSQAKFGDKNPAKRPEVRLKLKISRRINNLIRYLIILSEKK